jgi:hydroxyacylglutathione hydrolase
MYFRQLYDQSLAQASYLVGCQRTGEAIVIDPLRDPAPYLAVADAEGLRITHITETHIHADFVSGARELRAATGAQLFLSAEGGREWQYAYAVAEGATLLRDGDRIVVGNVHLDVMHTPGHTPEHLSFVVTDTPRGAGPMGILTGDFVFVGDVGRPDLLERAAHLANTMESAARTLFASLQRFRALPDHLQVWPGHGAGSACGKALGAVPSSTVGYEKIANWGVATSDEATFVQQVLEGQPEPPRYFADMKRINREGPALLGVRPPLRRLATSDVFPRDASCWLIDLRPAARFAEGFVPGSVSVPVTRSFSTWVGSLVPISAPIVLLTDRSTEAHERASAEAARAALQLIGFDEVRGALPAQELLEAWTAGGQRAGQIPQLSASQLAQLLRGPAERDRPALGPTVVDVRRETEWQGGHLPEAIHIPLGALPEQASSLPPAPIVVHCQSGVRSAIAASLLARMAFLRDEPPQVSNLVGGYSALSAQLSLA